MYREFLFIADSKDIIVFNYWNFLLEILQHENYFFARTLVHDVRMDRSSQRLPNKVNYLLKKNLFSL